MYIFADNSKTVEIVVFNLIQYFGNLIHNFANSFKYTLPPVLDYTTQP
jgi:hypothetical protein